MTTTVTPVNQEAINSVLLNTIRQFVVNELVTKHDQRIDLSHRLTENSSLIIDITNRPKQKKIIIIYQGDKIVSTPKARRRINAGTRYIPSYVEISANVRHYTFGTSEFLTSVNQGFSHSVLKSMTQHLIRELLNDTGYPIDPDSRIYAKAGKITSDSNSFTVDYRNTQLPLDTEYYRVVSIDDSDCYEKHDNTKLAIADNVSYSNFLSGKEHFKFTLSEEDSPKIGEANVGDYVVVYHAANNDSREEKNRKVIRFMKPQSFTHWFKT